MLSNLLIKLFVKNPEKVEEQEVRLAYGNLASLIGIFLNILLFAAKIFIAFFTKSVSIMADAVNNLSDFSSSIISWIGFKLAGKPADEGHPFGHGRYEYVSGLIVSIFIMVIGFEIFRSGIDKIIHPVNVEYSIPAFAVMVISIVVKFWMGLFYKKIGKKISSAALSASAQDSKNDVITTGAVLLAALITYLTGHNLDAIMAILVALFILWSGGGVLMETLNPLLGQALEKKEYNEYVERIKSYDGVLGCHDLMMHDYGPTRTFASVHVEMDENIRAANAHDIIDRIEHDFRDKDGIELTIHLDPVLAPGNRTLHESVELGERGMRKLTKEMQGVLEGIHPGLQAKDLQAVYGDKGIYVIFTVEKPAGTATSNRAYKQVIQQSVTENYPYYFAYVTVDGEEP